MLPLVPLGQWFPSWPCAPKGHLTPTLGTTALEEQWSVGKCCCNAGLVFNRTFHIFLCRHRRTTCGCLCTCTMLFLFVNFYFWGHVKSVLYRKHFASVVSYLKTLLMRRLLLPWYQQELSSLHLLRNREGFLTVASPRVFTGTLSTTILINAVNQYT